MINGQNRSLTLLVLASTYPRWLGDTEPGFVHELARRLTEHFRVIVLCPHAKGALVKETMEGVAVYRYRYGPESWETLVNGGGVVTNLRRQPWKWLLVPGFVLMQAYEAWHLCRSERVNVIHAHWLIPQGFLAAVLGCLPRCNVPFVVTSHGADLYTFKGRILQRLKCWVFSRAKATTVVSKAMRDVCVCMGADIEKISVLPMGVDMQERFVPDMMQPRSNSELLFVGRLVEKKGLSYLLEALPIVLRQRPDVTLTIVGFGPEEEHLRSQVSALGLGDVVHFLGAVPQAELPPFYQRAALFIAPFVQAESGDQEGLGLVLVEAIGCGCPVLAGSVSAVADVLGPDTASCTFDPRNSVGLAFSILKSLNQPQQAQAQAMLIKQRLQGEVDWTTIARRYAKILTMDCA